MANHKKPVQEYIAARKNVMSYFGCEGDFYIKPLMWAKWSIKQQDDYYILSYWTDDGPKTDAIVVKRSGEPMIYKSGDHTMVVGIDCVKIGFLFNNSNKRGA